MADAFKRSFRQSMRNVTKKATEAARELGMFFSLLTLEMLLPRACAFHQTIAIFLSVRKKLCVSFTHV